MIDIRLSDNLELMAEMQDNTVDLIYCDILYGTGRKFKDYQDLKPKREIIEEHYIPRIKEMHRILKDTGSIYLQMDNKISHWVRCIMDDIFNYSNFRNEIVWSYDLADNSKKNFAKKHDVIIFYTKKDKWTFNYNDIRIPYSDKTKKRYSSKSKVGFGGKNSELNKNGKIPNNVWKDIDIERMNNVYNTQKPKKLIERIIKASSNEGDLVADFYAGSFTTAEVCKDLNRNFIGCDISEKAVKIGRARVDSFAQE
jgi:DNA modification methylase